MSLAPTVGMAIPERRHYCDEGHSKQVEGNRDEQVKLALIIFRQRIVSWYRACKSRGESKITELNDVQ